MVLREIDNLAPVRTADFWDNISFYFGIGQKPKEEEPKTASGGIDWTTIAIIAVIAIVLVMLLKK